ncbi:hypothetical protein GDO81_029933 [Engystomops pustulosus]|uniref:Uncharacterized protein n=1 Tax=Engystomops pustulosus TaxID=76066 RepID=A0AAV6YIV8_ENGPU|nr:hypothetical protein GDO81_029933 [Engystomops pustulosus]
MSREQSSSSLLRMAGRGGAMPCHTAPECKLCGPEPPGAASWHPAPAAHQYIHPSAVMSLQGQLLSSSSHKVNCHTVPNP